MTRAYKLAVKHALVDPADAQAVVAVLNCSLRTANQLTEDAREDRKKAERSIAYQLHARGLTQTQIAKQVGVTQPTVRNWLINFGTVPELIADPVLPDAATLDAIAQAIKDDARREVRGQVEFEVRNEIAAGT